MALGPWANCRRQGLLEMLEWLDGSIEKLDKAVMQEANSRQAAARLMEHPGIGPVTSLAFAVMIRPVARLRKSKQLVSYLGLNPGSVVAGAINGSVPSANKETPCCVSCCWKPRKRPRGGMQNCGGTT